MGIDARRITTGSAVIVAVDEALRAFADEVGAEGPVAVQGRRTRWSAGGAPAPGVRLLVAPAGVVEHQPEEMTVRVRAGTTVADLDATLAGAGQRSALPDRGGTVGGALAVGESDVAVLGKGPVRNAVLQVRYVSADGRLVTGGGPTVKNVSGFDLPRLLVGSLGTLGLLAEVVLRTNPCPAEQRWLCSADVDPFAVSGTVLRPGAVLWDGSSTWTLIEGHPGDVDAQAGALAAIGTWTAAAGPPPLPANRWSLSPSGLRDLGRVDTGAFVASVGVGTLWAERPQVRSAMPAALAELHRRMKHGFDPTGRLNPGRRVEAR